MLSAFEGLDQSGKETQARQFMAALQADQRAVHAASFPDYGTPIGRELRQALDGHRDFGPEVMQLLYVANRFEYRDRLASWLSDGAIVVCDRYRASSVAYGEAQGLDPVWLEAIQRDLPPAALTVLLDLAPERAALRKPEARDRYERDLALLGRVRDSYLRQARTQHNWVVIDADQPRERVAEAISAAVWPRLARP